MWKYINTFHIHTSNYNGLLFRNIVNEDVCKVQLMTQHILTQVPGCAVCFGVHLSCNPFNHCYQLVTLGNVDFHV